jgi:hypothetical protein
VELREITRKLMAETELATGFQVAVSEDATLHTFAGVQMAAWDRPAHLIRIHPKAPAAFDYYIVYYCGMIQRFFENPPEERYLFGVGEKGRYHLRKLVARLPFAKRLGELAITPICEQLLAGFMTHLRTIPIGLRADNCVFNEHPELIEMQRLAIQPQLQDNNRTATDEFRNVCPPQVFDATMAINAAFAQFWAEKWEQPELALPSKASGHWAAGEKLLNILHDTPDSGRTDRTLIDAWGAELGVTQWYVWIPYRNPQRG